jgi:[acyl-carrier-protein] S-malonyltransferase
MQVMKTAFLFPGQGAQAVGMGRDIVQAFPAATEIFQEANRVIGFDLQSICFEGPAEKLNATVMSQPAIFTVSAAILEVMKTNAATSKIRPDVTAGLSLGEYSALYGAGVVSFEDGLKLVAKRGQAMQEAADKYGGAMVSVIGLDEAKVRQLCEEASEGELLTEVNFNCPGQIVISGTGTACDRAEKLASKYGALKAVRLDVAGAFHTEMMSSTTYALDEALRTIKMAEPNSVQIIANIDAEYYKSTGDIKEGLKKQLVSPVLWQKSMEKLIADGVDCFYEIGPGRVLSGLMKRINRKAKIINVSSAQAINELLNSQMKKGWQW